MTGRGFKHPCEGLPSDCVEAFERIAINQPPGCQWKTIEKLLAAGVIERVTGEKRRDALGVYEIPAFAVPLPIHYQWCEWCSANVGDGLS